MKPTEFKYFSGEVELAIHYPVRRELVRAKFPAGRIRKFDDFDLLVGTVNGRYDRENFLPVTRVICYNPRGSKHECGPRCRSAKGGDCECACGGQFHGVDRTA
jgi:hypothetical protein